MSVITVSQLNNYIKRYIESNNLISSVCVKGEISNFKRHSSGHIYLTLKDNSSSIKCVMFSSNVTNLKFLPDNGMKVIAIGKIAVYERDGVYQLYINEIVSDGKGDLYLAYEQLKAQLEQAGYFDPSVKMQIPCYPEKIGIITAPDGAALQDILNITKRRYPIAEIYVYPALVQGIGAAQSICKGIEYFNKNSVDVIICGRGGGSIEDLWAFNEKIVADAIYHSNIPIISAVGHETDYTISDFVSDMRAPTPSAAAELVVPDINQLKFYFDSINFRCATALKMLIDKKYDMYERFSIENLRLLFDNYISELQLYIDDIYDNLNSAYSDTLKLFDDLLKSHIIKLDALNPLKVLSRGYGVIKKDNKVVTGVNELVCGDNIDITLSDGVCKAKII